MVPPRRSPAPTATASAAIAGAGLVACLGLLAGSAQASPATDALLATEAVRVRRVTGEVPATPEDRRWSALPALEVSLAPQRFVRLGDAAANKELARAPVKARVRGALAGDALAILVEWPDATEDRVHPEETAVFADSIAIQFPLAYGPGRRLPYVGMGDESAHVAVFMQRATVAPSAATSAATTTKRSGKEAAKEKGATVLAGASGKPSSSGRDYVAAGFGSLTRASFGGSRMTMSYDRATRTWRAVFVRPLDAPALSLRAGLVPIAFAAWDGARSERGGNKALSSWKFLRLEDVPLDAPYAEELSWGFGPEPLGDVARGKQLVEGVCVACHRIGDKRAAVEDLAPDLTNIGAVSTPGYLRESLVEPSAIVVPILNINRHQARGQPPDATGAWQNNELYRWYTVDGAGKKVSRMMSFASSPPADIAAMVAYLRTLGREAPAAASPPPQAP
jgi:DMSO reductase family type II enzyme heme b subunit